MKQIITEHANGFKTYLVFEESQAISVFSKIAKSCGFYYAKSESDFDDLKEFWAKFEYKEYKGQGIYDYKCECLGLEFVDPEDGVKYSLTDCNQVSHGIKLISNLKVICKSQILN